MMNINAYTYSLNIAILYLYIFHYVYVFSCCIHIFSYYGYIFTLYLHVLMLYSCTFMFSNSYIGNCETNMVLCHRHHALPKKANWQSFANNAQQHAAALWKACSAGEASLAWQKALGVRTLSSVIDVVKLALADGVVGGMHGRRRCPPRTL